MTKIIMFVLLYVFFMKTYIISLISAVLLLLISCNGSNKDKYITTEAKVLDSVYNKNKKILIDICQEIELFDDIKKTFDQKISIADSLESSEDFMFKILPQLLTDSTYLNKEYKFDPLTTILVTRYDGLSLFGFKNDTSSIATKYKFDLDFFNEDERLISINFLAIWDAHNEKESNYDRHDSITINQKKEKIALFTKEFNEVKNSKYIVYAYDIQYLKPKIYLRERKFDSAVLITKVIVFDRVKKSKIGEKILLLTNSEELATLPAVMAGEENNIRLKVKEVESNLGYIKIKKILNYLKREKDSTDL